MSALADQVRTRRQLMAAPGSSHDKVIGVARVALPLAVVALAAFLMIAPLATGRDISFVLAKDRVDIAHERMRVTRADYRGQDTKGQPFRLTAASAVQQSSQDPIVRLTALGARVALADGPAAVVAPRGRYDMSAERLAIDGDVLFRDATGYRVRTRDVLVDLKTRRFASRAPVTGETPMGTFAGNRLAGDMTARTVRLDGRARLHIPSPRSKGAR